MRLFRNFIKCRHGPNPVISDMTSSWHLNNAGSSTRKLPKDCKHVRLVHGLPVSRRVMSEILAERRGQCRNTPLVDVNQYLFRWDPLIG